MTPTPPTPPTPGPTPAPTVRNGTSASIEAVALVGPPGSGKGTQGRALAALPDLHHFAMGDVVRALPVDSTQTTQSDQVRQVAQAAGAGELLPDALIMDLFRRELDRRIEGGAFDPASQTLILDGIPRTAEQAQRLAAHVRVLGVIDLRCSDTEELRRRLFGRSDQQGRADDRSVTVIRRRLDLFEQHHPQLADHYGERMVAVEAGQAALRVLGEIVSRLVEMLDRSAGRASASAASDRS